MNNTTAELKPGKPGGAITLFWFKRDLRIQDNAALDRALALGKPILPVYFLEPSLKANDHYSNRHFQFICESIQDLNQRFAQFDTQVLCIEEEVITGLNRLMECYEIANLVSTQEIGLNITYQRDKEVAAFCKAHQVTWIETRYNGVIRGLKNREGWAKNWQAYVSKPVVHPNLESATFISTAAIRQHAGRLQTFATQTEPHAFQRGGRTAGEEWMHSFFSSRISQFSEGVSKPLLSRDSCSRMSPYLAWGCLSVRELYKETQKLEATAAVKKGLTIFLGRLRLQSYFIQKFESQSYMEFRPLIAAFEALEQPRNDQYIAAWKEGCTGYPLVDASVRCIVQTGYLNFRMRSLIISFYAHHLFQHFKHIGGWLAQQFLDFEPGIHYGQMQMQSGFSGYDLVRVYNPTKNAYEHDADAAFIKMWVPELNALPPNLAIEPWLVTPMEELLYQFKPGVDYPARIVDIAVTRTVAMEALHATRHSKPAPNTKGARQLQ